MANYILSLSLLFARSLWQTHRQMDRQIIVAWAFPAPKYLIADYSLQIFVKPTINPKIIWMSWILLSQSMSLWSQKSELEWNLYLIWYWQRRICIFRYEDYHISQLHTVKITADMCHGWWFVEVYNNTCSHHLTVGIRRQLYNHIMGLLNLSSVCISLLFSSIISVPIFPEPVSSIAFSGAAGIILCDYYQYYNP